MGLYGKPGRAALRPERLHCARWRSHRSSTRWLRITPCVPPSGRPLAFLRYELDAHVLTAADCSWGKKPAVISDDVLYSR